MEKFSRTISLFGKDGFKKIKDARVAVVGIGGVGSYATEALARTGIGNLIIIDDDKIESSNINRQIWALESTVGKYKVDVAKERLLDINPELKLTASAERLTSETVGKLLPKNLDFVIDAIDSIKDKIALIEYCTQEGMAMISCMGAARRTDPTLIRVGNFSDERITGPLIRKLKKEIKKRGSLSINFPIIYSLEKAVETERGAPLPSCCFTTGAVGFAAAGFVCREIIKR